MKGTDEGKRRTFIARLNRLPSSIPSCDDPHSPGFTALAAEQTPFLGDLRVLL